MSQIDQTVNEQVRQLLGQLMIENLRLKAELIAARRLLHEAGFAETEAAAPPP